jgi:glucose dehydrogenase
VLVTGSSISDNSAVDMPSGVVRGYDARTGKLLWAWDPIPWAKSAEGAHRRRECLVHYRSR